MLQAPVAVRHARARLTDDLHGLRARFGQVLRPSRRQTPRAASRRRWHLPHPLAARPILARVGADRRLAPVVVLALILVASLAAALPASGAAIGGASGAGEAANPRIADLQAAADLTAPATPADAASTADSTDVSRATLLASLGEEDAASTGDYSADGTLLAPYAVPAAAASFQAQSYVVKSGDTLTGIASHFGLNMMTIWWANKLSAKDQLHVGEKLLIPPVDGVLYTAQEGDTVVSVAARYHADPQAIMQYDSLTSEELTLGQQIMIPDGVGAAIAVTAPAPATHTTATRPTTRAASGSTGGSGCQSCPFVPLAWPVPGGYISQGFHYGHWAIDIAAPWGSRIVAAAAGTVTFAGWKNNGGGYQVWISHGHNFYTTYNHMSSTAVYVGQHVGRGQFIGRVGMTGDATGPHCHFEVWIGPIWDGGQRVNPLNYF
ncbi:MAG TPA: M23 family metallopeptidase [Candidatus Limnocylindrales bacterium]